MVADSELAVFSQVQLDGRPYGRSLVVVLAPGVEVTTGFYPETPGDALGETANLWVMTSSDPVSPIATADVVLRMAAGVSCG